jgi:hypothetical protein
MKEVVVQLAPYAVKTSDTHRAFDMAKSLGFALQAIHPLSDDPGLARWFRAEVDNHKAAEFVQTLRAIPEVTAAYVKPAAEVP